MGLMSIYSASAPNLPVIYVAVYLWHMANVV